MVCDTLTAEIKQQVKTGLNPCFNGIWSATVNIYNLYLVTVVLILVLMEYGLRQAEEVSLTPELFVLILVLMEYGLRLSKRKYYDR